MDKYFDCAPARYKDEDLRAQRTMQELRAMMDAERTRPIALEARAKPRTPIQRMVDWLRGIVR